jgi:hypothetical protein
MAEQSVVRGNNGLGAHCKSRALAVRRNLDVSGH